MDTWLHLLKTGGEFFAEKNYPAAIDAFNNSIALNEYWDNYRGLGWALFHTNNYQAAIDAFKKSIALHEHWNTYLGIGSALLRTSNYPAAIEAFNNSIALKEHWDTYRGLGWALFHTNKYPAAIDVFNKSIALHEDWYTYQGLGSVLFRTNNYPEAIEAFNKSLALYEHWDTYRGLGSALLRINNYPAAIDVFNKSLALNENWNTYRGLGWALFHTNNYQAATDAFDKSIALHEDWDTYRGLGWALLRTNNYQAAIDVFNKSIALNEHWDTYRGLGSALLNTNNYPSAIAIDAFNKSIAIHKDWDTYQGLGWALLRTNNYPAAIDAFNNSIALNKNWDTYRGLGTALLRVNNYPAAIEAFNKSVTLNEHWNTYLGLGWALLRTNNYPEAIDAFNKSIALKEHWNTYLGLGSALLRTNDFPAAIDTFNKSIALNTHWDTYRGLGSALLNTNNYPAAIKAFRRSIALNENCETYLDLGAALFYAKDYRKALDAINGSLAINYSKLGQQQFHQIFSIASKKGKVDAAFSSFFESNNIPKTKLIKEYVQKKSNSLAVDPMLLKHASLVISNKDKGAVDPTDQEILESLQEFNLSKGIDDLGSIDLHRYVFGISHSRLHLTSPNTTVTNCTPARTMFNIGNPKSRATSFQKIISMIELLDSQKSVLIFEFGEEDIRNHIFNISKREAKSIFTIADRLVSGYVEFIVSLKSKGYKVMISGPHGGGGKKISRTSAIERNDLCAYINDALNLECQRNGLYFFTLFDKIVNQKTLKEIPGLFYDDIHLQLPPSKIGCALNTILNVRIEKALSEVGTRYQFFYQEDIHSDCNLLVSNIPSWQTGSKFTPGEEIPSKEKCLEIGSHVALIELPFLMHLKEVTLEFKRPAHNIKTSVQGVLESWDSSKETRADDAIKAYSEQKNGKSKNTSINHSFISRNNKDEMSRFLIVRIFSNSDGNHLSRISIKRWAHQFHYQRL